MLQNFLLSMNAVLPLFLMMLLGLVIRRKNWLNSEELRRVNQLIFHLVFPFYVFNSIYSSDFSTAISIPMLSFAVLATLTTFAIACYTVPKFVRSDASRGAMIQAFYRSNFVILGIPLVANIYPHASTGMPALTVALILPLYNILAVLTLEYFRGGRAKPKRILRNILTNPLILGCIFGVLCLPLELPPVIATSISQISAAATPMALLLLGASFRIQTKPSVRKNLCIATFVRLILAPGIILTLAAVLGFRDIAFAPLLSIFATPCSVSSFTMAQQLESDAELAGGAVVYTSFFSCFTMCLWIFLFMELNIL